MKRSLLAMGIFMVCAWGLAHAHHVIIRVNVGTAKKEKKPNVIGQPNLPGVIGQPRFPRPGIQPQKAPETAPIPTDGINVVVLLEYQKQQAIGLRDPKTGQLRTDMVWLFHDWGRTCVLFDQKQVHVTPLYESVVRNRPKFRPTIPEVFEDKWKKLQINKQATPADYLKEARWALTNGRLTSFLKVMEALGAKFKVIENPTDRKVVEAYRKTKENMKQSLTRNDPGLSWKLPNEMKLQRTAHYTLYYDAPTADAPEVVSRMSLLEENYQMFFYWLAMKGNVPPMPKYRQVAILLDDPAEFRKYWVGFGTPMMAEDGFYAQRENVVVFSTTPLDPAYEVATQRFQQMIRDGWDFKGLLDPKAQAQIFREKPDMYEDIARAMTMALVQKALHHESEQASVSFLGARQLFTAIGLLPRSVNLPDWVEFGLPSVFETPKFDRHTQTGAFWRTFGAPHWVYRVQWRNMDNKNKLEEPVVALKKVLSDTYFTEAQRERSRFRQDQKMIQAKTMAWGLSYYLANNHREALIRYCEELAKLPRYLDIDERVYLGCFARAFDMESAGAADGIDPTKFSRFAKDWYTFISITPFQQYKEMLVEADKAVRQGGR